MPNELFPVLSGLVIGAILGLVAPRMRLWMGIVLSILFGALATYLSGEAEISLGFLLIDIPLVAVSAFAGFLAMRRLRIGEWTLRP